jgi:uncharacterized protein YuzE
VEASYDPEADAAYVYVVPCDAIGPGCAVEQRVAEDGAIVDYDKEGTLLGYEMLSVRWRGLDAYRSVPEAGRRLVAEAMKLALARGHFVLLAADGTIRPSPRRQRV